MDIKQLTEAVAALTKRVEALEAKLTRDRGPKSTKEMTDEDAFRVKFGDCKDMKPKDAAEKLGLSYGQVFSCRGGYTFKHVKAEWKKPEAAKPEAAKV
jgi:hypothetical protein